MTWSASALFNLHRSGKECLAGCSLKEVTMFRRSAFAALLFAALPVAADYNAGVSAYARKDFPAARTAFLQVAQLADAQAQRALSSMYARGEGGDVDLLEAYAWASLAAEQGDPTASKIRDAIVASLPASVKPPAEAKLKDYRNKYSPDAVKRELYPVVNAADPAVYSLQLPAARLRQQHSVEYPERAKEKGDQGYACVGFYVGNNGAPVGIRRYDNKGSSALAAAAEKSLASWRFEPEPNERRVGYCVEFSIEDDKTWRSREQVQQLQARTRKGDAKSLTDLARELAAAQRAVTNRVEASVVTEAWLNAAVAGSAEAQYELASRLLRGDGCVTDRAKGLRWLQLAIAQDYLPAKHYAGQYLNGEKSVPYSAALLAEWLQSAASAGEQTAMLLRAKQLLRPGANQNANAALALLSKLEPEQDVHVRDWRAYGHALTGDFSNALDEAEEALELATEIGLATELRQQAVNALSTEQLPPLPAH